MSHRHLDPEALTAGLPVEWAEDARHALSALQDALTPESSQPPDDCPVCAGVAVLRDHGPLLLDRFAGAAAGLARTLREMTADTDARPEPDIPGDRGTAPSRPPAPPTTVRIDVSD